MRQKTALVTGGTSGIGLSMVRALVDDGARVYFIGTSAERGKRIEVELNATGAAAHFVQLDLSSLQAVRRFAADFASEVAELDLLANVAGVTLPTRNETVEGLEKTFAIGHLSAFLLSRELTPVLAKASHARIVNVSGIPSQMLKERLSFDDLDFAQNYSGIRAAFDTVHAKTVLTQVLAEKLGSAGIDVNAFHPGAVRSEIGRHMQFPMNLVLGVASRFMSRTSKSGIYLSTSPEVTGVTGQLFVKTKPRPLTFEKGYASRLWSATQSMVERALSARLAAA